ncbi:hypothetical protein KUTeg_007063 [Tegillarca granosa]|uniref:EF-hand domain-containing protein n=1 Tax=Tegillarca granosa TaxID=220873 RepID=A0ABQ9FC57_TEGGR|nr:hypothetical protein KUTeg_007063 [Tegillarca granosa]
MGWLFLRSYARLLHNLAYIFDTEGLGAIYTSKLLRKLGIDTTRRPKTFGGNECVQRSKDKTHRRSNSQIVTVETEETVTVKNETNNQKASEIRFNHEKFSEKNALNMTEVSTTHNESQTTGNNTKIQTSRKVGIRTEVPQETSMGIDPNKTKVLKAAIKKQVPKLDNIIDCLHYRFEESYNALSTAFNLFDQLEDGYIARLDFRRVLQEFGLNSSVTDLDYFLSRIGLRSIRGQINYKEFLNKFQSKAENSITTRIVTNKQYLSCDKYCLGVITPHEFKSGIEKRLGYLMSERQWEQLKTDVGQDKDGLIPYTKFLQLFDVFPGSWNKRQEGNIDVMQISPDDMPQPSAVNRLKEKAKSYMTQRDISVPRMDGTRTVAEIQKLLDELFKNRMHTFDKHFKEMDRKMMGRMSKWQFGALLKLCGLILTTSELDKIWGTLNVGSDGMYSYSALIRHFIQFKVLPGAEEKQNPIFEDTRELIEAAKLVQRERREHRLKSELEKTTTNISHSHTVEVEHANARESQHEISLIQQNQAPPKPCTTVMNTMQPSYVVTKPLSTKDLLVKCKQDVINNWNGLKSVFKFVDKGGTATITINEMMVSLLRIYEVFFTEY